MKTVFKTFMILLVSLIVVPFTVNAATTTYEDLPNGSYVIGKHIFTREGGALTVKKIMLASRTIEADNIEDMYIIYKDIMGNLKEVSNGKDADTNQYPDANVQLTDEIYYEYYNLKTNYIDGVIASAPNLGELVPIKHNGETWEYANTYEEWYNYADKEWANAVVLSEGVEKSIGDPISESEIDLWFVWVPRYEYKLQTESLFSSDSAIDVNFISSTVIEPTEGYSFHPGFAWDSDWSDGISEWKDGIWIGKFESSAESIPPLNMDLRLTIKPNSSSYRLNFISEFYSSSLNLSSNYGLTSLDSHMTRVTEWTTMSYLSKTIYGRCSSLTKCNMINRNTNEMYISGDGDYASNISQSTTGNITGIYDLNGGALEYTMGYLEGISGNSKFVELPSDAKYVDVFQHNATPSQKNGIIFGINGITSLNGTIGEILESDWYIHYDTPWYACGSFNNSEDEYSEYSAVLNDGDSFVNVGFRVALS